MKKAKVQLHAMVEKGLYDKFLASIQRKHGKREHGVISFEIAQALQVYLAHTQTSSKNNPSPKAFTWKSEIIEHLWTLGYDKVYNVPLEHVKAAIHTLYGTDPRTVKNKLDLLESYGCIKFPGREVVEFV